MVYNKIYFQAGPTGSPPNWKQFVQEAAAKSQPVYAIGTDSKATIDDVEEFGVAGSRCNFRPTGTLSPSEMRLIAPEWENDWGDYHLDIPIYNIYNSNHEAHSTYKRNAAYHVEATLFKLPIDLDLSVSTISTWNEVREYKGWCRINDTKPDECEKTIPGFGGWADVIGWQAYYIGVELVNRKNAGLPWFRWAAFAFAGGNPEKGVWESEGMLNYLRLAAENPDVLGVALHEYSFTLSIEDGFGDYIGRFEELLKTCDKHNIKRPWIEIKEWGWRQDIIPEKQKALADIAWCAEYYAKHPEVLMAAIWTTRGWPSKTDIRADVQALAPELYEWSLNTTFPDPDEPVEPPVEPPLPDPEETFDEWVWRMAKEGQVLSLNKDAALQAAMTQIPNQGPVGNEEWHTYTDGTKWAIQKAGSWEDEIERAYFAPVSDFGDVRFIADPANRPEPPIEPPIEQIEIADIVDSLPKHATKRYRSRAIKDITHLVIHHTVSPPDRPISGIAAFHVNTRGWPGIGYHYVINDLGEIYQTNYLDTISYQTGGQNHYSVGIALQGNFQKESPPQKQIDATAKLVEHLRGEVPTITDVEPHRGMPGQSTACPGNTWQDWFWQISGVVEPQPPEPPKQTVDLLPYLRGDGRQYEVRHPSGTTETFQTQSEGSTFYQVKNSQYETFHYDDHYIYRSVDTSPGGAPTYAERPGKARYYTQFDHNDNKAKWCRRYMVIGERFTGQGHTVQFYYKEDCKPSVANSGASVNTVTLVAHHKVKVFNNLVMEDVVELKTNTGESMFFARGYGLVGWSADWGSSGVFEIHMGRPDLIRERIPCL